MESSCKNWTPFLLSFFYRIFSKQKEHPLLKLKLADHNFKRGALMYKNYNMNQLVLPINLEVKLQDNVIAFVINDLVESIPDEAFHNFLQKTGRPSYHPRMMLKIILCAYSQSVFSGRKIEALLKDSIRMMWLAQGHEPSYRTINRFRVDPDVKDILRELFVQFR